MSESNIENQGLDPEQKFWHFLMDWAKEQNGVFIQQAPDQRESEGLIEGMAAVDMWGWFLPAGIPEPPEGEDPDDDFFGLVRWSVVDGHLHLEWVP